MSFSFRAVWYAAIVWIFAFLTSGLVVVPLYYVVMPLIVLLLTVYCFDTDPLKKIKKKNRDLFIKYGLLVAMFWFLTAGFFSFLELIGLYYLNIGFYFSDFKHIFLFPVILLTPVLYGILLSNKKYKSRKKKRLHTLRAPAF